MILACWLSTHFMCAVYCIYIWISFPQNKQVLILHLSWHGIDTHMNHQLQLFPNTGHFAYTHRPEHSHTHILPFRQLLSSLLSKSLTSPYPRAKRAGRKSNGWCVNSNKPMSLTFPPCPCNSPLETPFACIMAPVFLFPLSHPPSSRERSTERVKYKWGMGACLLKGWFTVSARERENKRTDRECEMYVW